MILIIFLKLASKFGRLMRWLIKKLFVEYDYYFFPRNVIDNLMKQFHPVLYRSKVLFKQDVLRILLKFRITRYLVLLDFNILIYYRYRKKLLRRLFWMKIRKRRFFTFKALFYRFILKKIRYVTRRFRFYINKAKLYFYYFHIPKKFKYIKKTIYKKNGLRRTGFNYKHRKNQENVYHDFLKAKFTQNYLRKYVPYVDDIFYDNMHCEYLSSNQCQNERYKLNRPMYFKYAKELLYLLDFFLLGSNAIANPDLKIKNKDLLKYRKKAEIDEYHSLSDYILEKKIKEPFLNKYNKIKISIITFIFLPILVLITIFKYLQNYSEYFKKNLIINQIIKKNSIYTGLKEGIILYIKQNWWLWKIKYQIIKDIDIIIQRYYYCKKIYKNSGAYFCSRVDNTYFEIEIIKIRLKAFLETLKAPLIYIISECYFLFGIILYYYPLDITLLYKNYLYFHFLIFFPFFLGIVLRMLSRIPKDADPMDYTFDNVTPYYHNPKLDVPAGSHPFQRRLANKYHFNNNTGKNFYDENEYNEAYNLLMDDGLIKKPMRALHREHCFTLSEEERVREVEFLVAAFKPQLDYTKVDLIKKNGLAYFTKNMHEIFIDEMEYSFAYTPTKTTDVAKFATMTLLDRNFRIKITHPSGYEYIREIDHVKRFDRTFDLYLSTRYHMPMSYFDKRVDFTLFTRDPHYRAQDENIFSYADLDVMYYRKAFYYHERHPALTKRQKVKRFFRFVGVDLFKADEEVLDEVEFSEDLYPMSLNTDFAFIGEYDGDVENDDHDEATTYYYYQKTARNFEKGFSYFRRYRGQAMLETHQYQFDLFDKDEFYNQFHFLLSENEYFNAPKYVFQMLPLNQRYLEMIEDSGNTRQSKELARWISIHRRFVRRKLVYLRFYKLKTFHSQYLTPLKMGSPILTRGKRYDANPRTVYPVIEMVIDLKFFLSYLHPKLMMNATHRRRRYTRRTRHYEIYIFFDGYPKKLSGRLMNIDPLKEFFPKMKNLKATSINFLCSKKNYYELLYEEVKDAFSYHILGFYLVMLGIISLYLLCCLNFFLFRNNYGLLLFDVLNVNISKYDNDTINLGSLFHMFCGFSDYLLPILSYIGDAAKTHYLTHWNVQSSLDEFNFNMVWGYHSLYKNAEGYYYKNDWEDECIRENLDEFDPFIHNGLHVPYPHNYADLDTAPYFGTSYPDGKHFVKTNIQDSHGWYKPRNIILSQYKSNGAEVGYVKFLTKEEVIKKYNLEFVNED